MSTLITTSINILTVTQQLGGTTTMGHRNSNVSPVTNWSPATDLLPRNTSSPVTDSLSGNNVGDLRPPNTRQTKKIRRELFTQYQVNIV